MPIKRKNDNAADNLGGEEGGSGVGGMGLGTISVDLWREGGGGGKRG